MQDGESVVFTIPYLEKCLTIIILRIVDLK